METISSENNKSTKKYIVFFDLDHTIISTVSGTLLVKGAMRKGLMTPGQFTRILFLWMIYRLKMRDPAKIINLLIDWLKGLTEKDIAELCSVVFNEEIKASVYEEAREAVRIHKEKNAHVVILSSALVYICREIADILEIDDIICSRLEVKNGYLTGQTEGPLCFGEEKVRKLREYCEKNNAVIADTWYYGDSVSDLPALSIAGNPVCINPDKKLKKAAAGRGWKVLYWHH